MSGSVFPDQISLCIEDELSWHPPGISNRSSLTDPLAPCLKAPFDHWGREELSQPSSLQAIFLVELCFWVTGKMMRRVHCVLKLTRLIWLGLTDEEDVPVRMGIEILHLLPAEDAAQMAQKDHDHGIIPVELSGVTLFA